MTWKTLPRSFWVLLALVAGLSAGLAFVRHSGWPSWSPVVALIACALALPKATARVSERLRRGLRRVVRKLTGVVIGIAYFGLFVPLGFALRLVSRAPNDASAESLWIARGNSSTGDSSGGGARP